MSAGPRGNVQVLATIERGDRGWYWQGFGFNTIGAPALTLDDAKRDVMRAAKQCFAASARAKEERRRQREAAA